MSCKPLIFSRVLFRTFAITTSVMLLVVVSGAGAFEPVFTPDLEIDRTSGDIEIDGKLDDAGWSVAGRADNFAERSPGENIEPLVSTEAYITYDDDNLYVAFVCTDDPSEVRATMCQRDQYFGDDAVGLFIDTYGEATWAYEFYVNPYGIQKDLMWTNVHGEDPGFDLIWYSAAQITDSGYTVEMAIPLSSMRFPNREVQSWRVDFQRVHPRDSYRQYAWSAVDRNEQCFPCQWGTVSGITGVRPGKGLEILPSFISYQSGEIVDSLDSDSAFDNKDVKGEMSLGAKYSVSSDVTIEGAVNPDFSQIEADADQIDVNTTIVQRYPERRPFFQEGSDLFRTMFNSFYTRMVNDPELAAKGTARWDQTSFAYVVARDEHSPYMIPTEERSYSAQPGKSNVHVLRGLHSLGNNSQIGGMVTDRRYDSGGSGTILSGDANIRLSSSFRWMTQFVYSDTREPEDMEISPGETFDNGKYTVDLDGESYGGTALITELRRNSRHWNMTLDYNQLTPSYRTQTGYDPWNDQKNAFIFTNYNIYPEGGIFERIRPSIFCDGRWNFNGDRKWIHYNGSMNFRLRWAQTNIGFGYRGGTETWGGVEFENLWSFNMNMGTRPSDKLGIFAFGRVGQNPAFSTLDKGDELSLSLALDFKPIDWLMFEPTFDYIQSKDAITGNLLFKQTITRARLRMQVNPRLSVRLIVQHNSSNNPEYEQAAQDGNFPSYHMYFGSKWEIDPLVTYRINPFSVFYFGSMHDYRDFNSALPGQPSLHRMTDRQFFMKLQYLFQV